MTTVILIASGIVIAACWVLSLEHMRRDALAEARKFATLLDAAPEAIIGVGDDGAIRFVNARVLELLGYTEADLIGAPVELLIPERFHAAHVSARRRFIQRPRGRPMGTGIALIARRKDGAEVPVEISLNRIDTRRKHVVLCILRDVTEQTRTQEALRQSNRELSVRVEEIGRRAEELRQIASMGEFLQCCATEQEVRSIITGTIAKLFGSSQGAIYLLNASRNLSELTDVWGSDQPQFPATFSPQECWGLRRGRLHHRQRESAASCCGHVSAAEERDSVCVPMAAQGEIIGILHVRLECPGEAADRPYIQVMRAVAEQGGLAMANLRLREALRMQSIRDPLTGLYNRRFLSEWLEREISRSRRNGSSFAVLMLDLDHFKRFNDAFGHQSGDLALREVCALLQQSVRGSDVVCRYGGEEIAVLLPDSELEHAMRVGEKIREQIERLSVHRNGEALGALTVSVGAAVYPRNGSTVEEVLDAADVALYTAKNAGRNRVVSASLAP